MFQIHEDNFLEEDFQPPPPLKKLSAIEQAFVEEYCRDLCATRAYRRIRPNCGTSVRQVASEMKRRPHVDRAITVRLTEKNEWRQGAQREVIEELLACMRNANVNNFVEVKKSYNEFGFETRELLIKDFDGLSNNTLKGLAEVNIKEFQGGHSVRVKPLNKIQLLALLVKVLGMANQDEEDEDGEMENVLRVIESQFRRSARRPKSLAQENAGANGPGESCPSV